MRVWLVGTGTVGRWLLRALHEQSRRLRERYGVAPTVVALANARDGFVYDARGIDPGGLGERPLTELPGARHWPTALEGMRATEADVLVEVTASPRAGGEPGVAHMREALARGTHVVTSNKWPVALCGVPGGRGDRSLPPSQCPGPGRLYVWARTDRRAPQARDFT